MASRAKVKQVMKEFTGGTLKSSDGKKVTTRKQALAIALGEPKGALHGAVVTRQRSPAQFPKPPMIEPIKPRATLPSQASPTAVAAVAKPSSKSKRIRNLKRLKGAQEGTIVDAGPMAANLPEAPAAPPPPDVIIDTAADIIKAAIGELRATGTFPPAGGTPIAAPLGVQAPPPTPLG